MTPACESRIGANGDFCDGEAFQLNQCRHEPVHPFEKFHVLDAFAFKRAVTTTGIADVVAGQLITHPVGDAGRSDFNKTVAFAAARNAGAANAVIIFQAFQKFGEVFWVVLQVRVEGDDVFAVRGFHSSPMRRRFSTIESQPQRADARVGSGQFLEDFPGAVLATIVRDDDFVSELQRFDGGTDGLDQFAQVAFLIIARDDEADFERKLVHKFKRAD